jgi:hypothetical protein
MEGFRPADGRRGGELEARDMATYMAKITEMNRANVRTISAAAEEALRPIAEQYGLQVRKEGGSFDPAGGSYTGKFTFTCETADGVPADFARNAALFGLSADDWGRRFSTHNGTYEICGIKLRNRKYPILGRCIATGRTFKFQTTAVSQLPQAVG